MTTSKLLHLARAVLVRAALVAVAYSAMHVLGPIGTVGGLVLLADVYIDARAASK